MTEDNPAPRAFISYAWTSPTHQSWVKDLATRLREDGVDVILDIWDLKPGHDSYQFMESMVTDKSVTKVLMICDRNYVEKADKRSGGVGTESQIISPELYGRATQDKYAAVMIDEDEAGSAHAPVFYKGRIFFDFRSADRHEASYEELLRWLIDRPQHVKPKLGAVPEALLGTAPVASGTRSRARRVEEALRQASNAAPGLIREYGEALVDELKALSPVQADEEPFDETVIKAVNAMRPYARQFAEIVQTAVRFAQNDRVWDSILAVHEHLGTLMFRDRDMMQWNRHQFDAFKIIAHDSFVSTVALALDEERFDLVEKALSRPFLVDLSDHGRSRTTADFSVFRQYVESIDVRKQRLKSNKISLDAELLHEAFPRGSVPSFDSLMQADFVLFVRAMGQSSRNNWYPYSLIFATDRFAPFPIFARAESLRYFDRIAGLLGTTSPDTFKNDLTKLANSDICRRMFDHHGLPVRVRTH